MESSYLESLRIPVEIGGVDISDTTLAYPDRGFGFGYNLGLGYDYECA